MNQQEKTSWAKTELASIMQGNKTRYKQLLEDSVKLQQLEDSLLSVAMHKSQAYDRATKGEVLTSFNWINNEKELANAILILSENFVPIGEISIIND